MLVLPREPLKDLISPSIVAQEDAQKRKQRLKQEKMERDRK